MKNQIFFKVWDQIAANQNLKPSNFTVGIDHDSLNYLLSNLFEWLQLFVRTAAQQTGPQTENWQDVKVHAGTVELRFLNFLQDGWGTRRGGTAQYLPPPSPALIQRDEWAAVYTEGICGRLRVDQSWIRPISSSWYWIGPTMTCAATASSSFFIQIRRVSYFNTTKFF